MNERAVFDPWNNAQDKLIADYNTVSEQAGATLIHSSSLLCGSIEVLLAELLQADSRLQGPSILVSGLGVLNAAKIAAPGSSASAIITQLLKNGSAANGKIQVLDVQGDTATTEEQELRNFVFANHRTQKQIVIAQDKAFLEELRQLCKADAAAAQSLPALVTLRVNDKGELANPFDLLYSCEAEKIAVERLSATAQRSLMCIDVSGLKHEQAPDFLRHVKAPLIAANAQLVVFAYKDQPLPHADLLIARAQEPPVTVRFVYLNRDLPTSDAIVEAILKEEPGLAGKSIVFITDKVTTGARVVNQLGRSSLKLSVFSINRHGFLSNVDRAIIAQANVRGSVVPEIRRAIAEGIRTDDEETVTALVTRSRFGRDALEHGIIAALRLGKDKYVERLIKLADACSPIALNWWVLDYPGFKVPTYLSDNSLHFRLLKELIAKTVRKHGFQLPLEHLKELNEVPAASHDKLGELISLMETDVAVEEKSLVSRAAKKAVAENTPHESRHLSPAQVALSYMTRITMREGEIFRGLKYEFTIGMTFLKRLHDCLQHDEASVPCENTSGIAFSDLIVYGGVSIERLKEFCQGFSQNVQAILQDLRFIEAMDWLQKEGVFIQKVVEALLEPVGNFSPERFSNADFVELLATLIQGHAESDYECGMHYSSNEVSELMSDLLASGQALGNRTNISICDIAVGSTTTLRSLEQKLETILGCRIDAYGADFNILTATIAKIITFVRGRNPENIVHSDISKEDAFADRMFDYVVCDPPYGMRMDRNRTRGIEGYPATTDSSFYFLLAGLSKLNAQGKLAILQPGRSLFSSRRADNEVRRYLIENDLLEAVVQLPSRLAICTSIPLYVWIINKNKPEERRGKVLLIDAANCGGVMQKAGVARCRALPKEARNLILQAYEAFENEAVLGDPEKMRCECRVVENHRFGYRKITVDHPVLTKTGKVQMKHGKPEANRALREEFIVAWDESPDVFFAREVLPMAPNAWIDHSRTTEHFDIQMSALFYKVPEGETLDGSLTRNITSLRDRVSELKEEMEAKMRTYQERLDTLKEKLEAFELIAAQRPGLKGKLATRSATLPR